MNTHFINGEKLHVYFDEDRAFWGIDPWVATWDGYDGTPIDYETPSSDPIGVGSTEQEAMEDLLERTEDLLERTND